MSGIWNWSAVEGSVSRSDLYDYNWDREFVGSRASVLARTRRSAPRDHSDESFVIVPESWATEGACVVPTWVGPTLARATWNVFDEPNIGPNAGPTARAERLALVRRICADCPVLAECREYGMGQEYGFYGGLTPEERAARRRGDERAHEAIVAELRESERNQRALRGLDQPATEETA